MTAAGLAGRLARPLVALACLLGALVRPGVLRAQDVACDAGDVEVRSLDIRGNERFSDDELELGIVTTPSSRFRTVPPFSWLKVFGARRCLDRTELPRDVVRLTLFYRTRGYPDAKVDTLLRYPTRDQVNVTFTVAEGRPMLVDSLRVRGIAELPTASREAVARAFGTRPERPTDSLAAALVRAIPLRLGRPFDRTLLQASRDTLRRRLRNAGFPDADVLRQFRTDAVARRARVDYTVVPGPLARIGEVVITSRGLRDSTPHIATSTVRGLVGVRPGDLYRERSLERAKRNLYQTDAYRHVELLVDSLAPGDSLVTVRLDLEETNMHSARLGLGGGTLDCVRTSGELVDRDFLGGARRLELSARISKIGVGEPVRVQDFQGLCRQARDDPYSERLNYYLGATFRQPVLFGLRSVPTVTLFTERRSEYKAFLRTTNVGGIASLTSQRFGLGPITTAYQLEYGRTDAQPALFCAVFNVCEDSAQASLRETKRSAVLSATFVNDESLPRGAANPTSGSVFRAELRHASTLILSDEDLAFNRGTVDGSLYLPTAGGNVLALRLRLGAVVGATPTFVAARRFIPPQERLYAGGANSVRGYRQNELGPAIYVLHERDTRLDSLPDDPATPVAGDSVWFLRPRPEVDSLGGGVRPARSVPTGGNSLIVASAEYRMRSPILPELVQLVTFVDVGEVWNRQGSETVKFANLRWTPGAGLRIYSPFGAFRMDVGYNARKAPAGPAYVERLARNQGASVQPLFCATATNAVALVKEIDPGTSREILVPRDRGATCTGSFAPPDRSTFFRRLTFNFSIGQAF